MNTDFTRPTLKLAMAAPVAIAMALAGCSDNDRMDDDPVMAPSPTRTGATSMVSRKRYWSSRSASGSRGKAKSSLRLSNSLDVSAL